MKKYFFVLIIASFILTACTSFNVKTNNDDYIDIPEISNDVNDTKKQQVLDKEKNMTKVELERFEQDVYVEEVKTFGWIKMSEVEKHNKEKDCWVVIHDRIFDVTEYGNFSNNYVLEGCGIDITYDLEKHNIYLDDTLDEYYLGDLEL